MDYPVLQFPKDFLFGSATAAHQVEGDDGQRSTDWDVFLKQYPEILKLNEKGPQWWKKGNAEHDIKTMATLGLKVQRISISWGRIEPQKGSINLEAVARYKEIIKEIKDNGMLPMVTLNHYALPQWVAREGSWENKRAIGHFEHFVKFMVLEFPDVKYWLTINEPNFLVVLAYFSHFFPPAKNNIFAASVARWNMLEAHKRAYKKIKSIDPTSKVGIAFGFRWNIPQHRRNPLDVVYSKIVNHVSVGSYIDAIKKQTDFIGCNYYTGYLLSLDVRRLRFRARQKDRLTAKTLLFGETRAQESYKSDFGWPIVPEIFLDVLRYLHKSFKLPIIITENGVADSKDKNRAFYIITHLTAVWKAIDEGIPIEQYIHWATVDNLEWAVGFTKDFGLIESDPITGERRIRKSAFMYKNIATKKEINIKSLCEKYLEGEQKENAYSTIEKLLKNGSNKKPHDGSKFVSPRELG